MEENGNQALRDWHQNRHQSFERWGYGRGGRRKRDGYHYYIKYSAMDKTLLKFLAQSWQPGISRNVPIWHDELNLRNAATTYPYYQVPMLWQCRVHRGTHGDFYYTEQGKYSRQAFITALAERFKKPSYLAFLKKTYTIQGDKLMRLSKKTKPQHASLQKFFNFYAHCIPMLDLTAMGSKYVTNKVLELISPYNNQPEIIAYYARPRRLAPVQKLQRELDGLSGQKINSINTAKKLHEKYFWIPTNFVGEPWPLNYFIDRLKNNKPDQSPTPLKPKEKLSKEARYYLDLLGEIAGLNEFRKSIFARTCWYIRQTYDQLAKQHGLTSWQDISLLSSQEILDLAQGKDDYQKELLPKRQLCAMFNDTVSSVTFIYGKDVELFEKKFKPTGEGLKEVSGTIANQGIVVGNAKIVLEPRDFKKFQAGDILIAKMTSVDFIPIMKRAGAFVTDEGGLASHAAIVAREYNKPCVVGTKLGTVVFKDGDRVEVNAERGIVKIVKKYE